MFSNYSFLIVWAATTSNEDFLRAEGMKRLIDDPVHRKEVVAGNMSKLLTKSEHAFTIYLNSFADSFDRISRSNRSPRGQSGRIS